MVNRPPGETRHVKKSVNAPLHYPTRVVRKRATVCPPDENAPTQLSVWQLFRAYRNVYVVCDNCPHFNDRVRLLYPALFGKERFQRITSDASVLPDSPPLPTDPDHRPLLFFEWKAFLRREKKLCKTLEMCYECIDVCLLSVDDATVWDRKTTWRNVHAVSERVQR